MGKLHAAFGYNPYDQHLADLRCLVVINRQRFGRAEILAGLANGLFLLFIALFILKEAIERTLEPPEVHHERLFIVSVLGFLVNIVGIFVFQHGGQGHKHGSHDCGLHSHSTNKHHEHDHHQHHHHHDHHEDHRHTHYDQQESMHVSRPAGVVALDMNGSTASDYTHTHQHVSNGSSNIIDHTHNHKHHAHEHEMSEAPLVGFAQTNHSHEHHKSSGRGQIMQSVFLHIVADTLGSVGVMISALLMNMFGWMIADPICSIFIAVLISISVYPLLRDSVYVLMQRVPVDIEDKIPECLYRIQNIDGVLSVHDAHFWTLYSDNYVGSLKLEVKQAANHRHVLTNAKYILTQIGIERLHIQIDPV